MNNTNSQHAHLLQAQLSAKKAQDRCVIQLDDTFKRGNTWTVKGGTALPRSGTPPKKIASHFAT